MVIKVCPYCTSQEIYYLGIVDGCGPCGEDVCDEWTCEACGREFEEPDEEWVGDEDVEE